MTTLSTIEIYQWINAGLLVGLLFLAFFLCLVSSLFTSQQSNNTLHYAPGVVKEHFPQMRDLILTTFSMAFLGFLFTYSSLTPKVETDVAKLDVMSAIMNNVIMLIIYSPLLLRFASLPKNFEIQRPSFIKTMGCILFSLIAVYICSGIISQLGLIEWLINISGSPTHQATVNDFPQYSPQIKIITAISAVIIAPITEEITFRGFLYPCLKKYIGRWGGILLSALIFGAIHTSLAQFISLSILGIALCLVYEYTRSIKGPILLHMIFNAIAIYILYADLTF